MRSRKEIQKILDTNAAEKDEVIIELLLDIRHLLWYSSPIWDSKEDV